MNADAERTRHHGQYLISGSQDILLPRAAYNESTTDSLSRTGDEELVHGSRNANSSKSPLNKQSDGMIC